MSETLKPVEGERDSNLIDGEDNDESLDALFADIDDNDEESNLEKINKATGKDFKSMKDVAKSLSQLDKLFPQNGFKKKEEIKKEDATMTSMPKIFESIYFKTNPEAKAVWPKVQKVAQKMGRDPFEVYEDDDFSFLRTEAQALYDDTEEVDKNGKKVNKPSKKVTGSKSSGVEFSDADRALLKRRGLKESDVKFN